MIRRGEYPNGIISIEMISRTFRRRVLLGSFFCGSLAAFAMACGVDTVTADPTPDDAGTDASTMDVAQPEASTEDGALPDSAPPDTNVEAFCEETLGLYAPKFEQCCDATDAPKLYAFDHTLLKGVAAACTTSLGKSVESGRATFAPEAAATCQTNVRAEIEERTCPEVLHAPSNQSSKSIFKGAEGCSDAIVGHQGADAPCSNDYECADGLTCIGWTSTSDGACKTPPGEGDLCGYAIPDAGGFVELVRWGFGTHSRCAAGLYCASTALQQGTCRASKAADDTCDSDDECAEGLRCQFGTCGTAGPVPADAPCKRNSDCQDRLYCKSGDGGRTCAPREVAGTPCSGALSSECQGACVEPDGGSATCVAFCGSP